MPPIEILTGTWIAKYAPVFFLTISKDGLRLNWGQVAHTLVVSGIVALVTMYGTTRVVEAKMTSMETVVNKMADRLEKVADRQNAVVPQADLIHKQLSDRVTALEKHK